MKTVSLVFICEHCSRPFVRPQKAVTQAEKCGYRIRFCSIPCRRSCMAQNKMTRLEVGRRYREKHRRPFERMTEPEAQYRSRDYFGGLRDQVLDREDRRCLMCGQTQQLIVHHKDGNKDHNELANLIALCRRCHPKVHSRWGLKEVAA